MMALVDHIDAFTTSIRTLAPDDWSKLLIVLDAREDRRRKAAEGLFDANLSDDVVDLAMRIAADRAMGPVATAQLRELVTRASPESPRIR